MVQKLRGQIERMLEDSKHSTAAASATVSGGHTHSGSSHNLNAANTGSSSSAGGHSSGASPQLKRTPSTGSPARGPVHVDAVKRVSAASSSTMSTPASRQSQHQQPSAPTQPPLQKAASTATPGKHQPATAPKEQKGREVETLYTRRLMKEPKLRKELYLSGHSSADVPVGGTDGNLSPVSTNGGKHPPMTNETNPLLAFSHAQLVGGLSREHALAVFNIYHPPPPGKTVSTKGMETKEMRVLARDVVERVLWNFAETVVIKANPDITGARLDQTLDEEKPFILPSTTSGSDKGDKQVITAMARHLSRSLCVGGDKSSHLPKITAEMFALQWNKTIKQLLGSAMGRTADTGSSGGGCCAL